MHQCNIKFNFNFNCNKNPMTLQLPKINKWWDDIYQYISWWWTYILLIKHEIFFFFFLIVTFERNFEILFEFNVELMLLKYLISYI
jgi:hypothetical protein